MFEVTILGTSCMMPTKERNHSSIYIEYLGTGVLFDCGEGTQRQMTMLDIPKSKIKYICISHWHADHTAGLLGLIQTIGASSENPSLTIIGPPRSKEYVTHILASSSFERQFPIEILEFDCENETCVLKTEDFSVNAINLYHIIPCLGFSFIESDKRKMNVQKLISAGIPQGPLYAQLQKGINILYKEKEYLSKDYTQTIKGKKFTYIADTAFTENAILLAKDSDLLLSEASYASEHADKAEEYFHMTSFEAAQIASASNSKQLLLTHFSQRYKDIQILVDEAQSIFPETSAAFDFQKIVLK